MYPCIVVMASTRTSPRTASKNKGIARGGPIVIDDIDHVYKAVWDTESIRFFLELISDEIIGGNRPFMVLSTAGYKSLAKKFEKKRGRKHDVKQLKNKYANLKKDWTAWIKLMDHTKGIIGIGFDNETGLFQAFDEWWERMETINKTCVKFKMKPLEHCELMEIVFTGAAVTDKHHWTLAKRLSKITSALLIRFRALVYGHSQIKSLQLGLKWRLNRQWKVLK